MHAQIRVACQGEEDDGHKEVGNSLLAGANGGNGSRGGVEGAMGREVLLENSERDRVSCEMSATIHVMTALHLDEPHIGAWASVQHVSAM